MLIVFFFVCNYFQEKYPKLVRIQDSTPIPTSRGCCSGSSGEGRNCMNAEKVAGVSQDRDQKIIQILRDSDKVDFVLSSGALASVVGSRCGRAEQWEIPMVIKEVLGTSGLRKMVFLDRPLLPRTLTARRKSEIYYRHALLHPMVADGGGFDASFAYNILELGEMQILVRSDVCGEVSLGRKSCRARVEVKMEYWAKRGMEEVTESEGSRWWSYLQVGRGSALRVARVNAYNSQLLRLDDYDLRAVCRFFK